MRKLSDWVMTVVMLLFLFSAAVSLTLAFKPLYYFDIGNLKIDEATGYSQEEIRENYDALIDYNLSFKEKELVFPTLEMSEEGRQHFREVRAIFQFFLRMFLATAVFSAVGIVWKDGRKEYEYLKFTGIAAPVLPLALGVMIAVNWEDVFVLFHKIVFRNDYWLFDPKTDPVINILPDEFFMHCAVMIVLIIAFGAAACLAAYRKRKL
ncbi:MAG: TIGR01906 family membrane protein [Eubacteriales bacterium]|nr:TIGR01906 family membrane protein [Eubacteriales bacterium]